VAVLVEIDEEEDPPGLQDKVPVAVVVRYDIPHSLSTDTTGAAGTSLSADTGLAATLVHPLALVWVTVYVPAVVTVITDVVWAVLQ